ncbi:protein tramtrack, alpha isoform isoform X1 [Nilaparvata lugens]|uniref:protein tramtrack, alpha isoform isoform X1 n=1 Tax=Nilaparvata lugens TaxID=108931 RepID=UPI00193DFA29|nr:protein tramtrack, alpha isoform isoform X1 [Nilaparvata lugens]
MAAQQFCLRWNNHQPNFISVFSNLLSSESLVDVTLAAEGKHVQAHKVVLSACSSYFQSLFTVNPCQHPIVILKDIKYSDLKTMIDFMYCGEVNVSQEQLPAILKTAETLKVKGLAEMGPDQNMLCVASDNKDALPLSTHSSPSMLRRKRLRKSSTGSGSGSTEQTTVGSEDQGGGGGCSAVASSPLTVKAEGLSENESSLRHEPSTDSEHGLPSQDSVDDMSEATNSQVTGNQTGGHHTAPQNQSSTSSDDKSDITLGRSSSTEDNSSPSVTSQSHFTTGDQPSGSVTTTMGSKRGRLLLRQNRIKRECDPIQVASEPTADDATPGESTVTTATISVVPVPRLMERQCSEPGPSTSGASLCGASQQLLSVPQPAFLIKQHSSPQLQVTSPSPSTSASTSSSSAHLQVASSSQSETTPRHKEELRRTASSPQCSTSSEVSISGRSCHCPVQRPGPALGCNYCWNTIDAHGRILRRKTKYHCPECQTNLCIVPCFQEYHERQPNNSGGSSSREVSQSAASNANSSTLSPVPTIMKTSSM